MLGKMFLPLNSSHPHTTIILPFSLPLISTAADNHLVEALIRRLLIPSTSPPPPYLFRLFKLSLNLDLLFLQILTIPSLLANDFGLKLEIVLLWLIYESFLIILVSFVGLDIRFCLLIVETHDVKLVPQSYFIFSE
jgi:hypothetical protein